MTDGTELTKFAMYIEDEDEDDNELIPYGLGIISTFAIVRYLSHVMVISEKDPSNVPDDFLNRVSEYIKD